MKSNKLSLGLYKNSFHLSAGVCVCACVCVCVCLRFIVLRRVAGNLSIVLRVSKNEMIFFTCSISQGMCFCVI